MRILIFILLFINSPLWGATYYVSGSGDDDTGDGSIGNPWATLSYAVDQATSGDWIYLRSAIVDNTIAYVPTGVNIDLGGYSVTTSVAATGYTGYLTYSSTNLTNGNQTLRNGSIISSPSISTNTERRGITVYHRYNVDILTVNVTNFPASGIFYQNEIDWRTPPTTYATGNSVVNCIITNCGDRHYNHEGGLRATGQQGFIFRNSTIDNRGRSGSRNGNSMNFSNCITVDIYDCIFYRNDDNGNEGYAYDWNFYAEIFQCRGLEVNDCEFYGAATLDAANPYGDMSYRDTCDFTLSFHDNYFQTASGSQIANRIVARNQIAITVERSYEYVYIYNNYIKSYPTGIELATPSEATPFTLSHIYIYNNVLDNIGYTEYAYTYGIQVLNEPASGAITTDNVHIWNNTIYGGSGNNYIGIEWTAEDVVTNSSIKNNIIRGFSTAPVALRKQGSATSCTFNGFDVTYNDFYENGNSNNVSVGGGVIRLSGDITTGNMEVDPLWVSTGDFRLTETSPVIGEGINVGLSTDYLGATWLDPPSMGAYEYGTPIEPPIIIDYPTGLIKSANRFIILNNKLLKLE